MVQTRNQQRHKKLGVSSTFFQNQAPGSYAQLDLAMSIVIVYSISTVLNTRGPMKLIQWVKIVSLILHDIKNVSFYDLKLLSLQMNFRNPLSK